VIHYQLVCRKGDRFEAWFRGSADFDQQARNGHVVCPICGTSAVEKALMAPAVRSAGADAAQGGEAAPKNDTEQETVRLAAGPDPALSDAMEMARRISRDVREHSEDVGRRFAEEARKIHYREAAPRSIYGEATGEEVKEMLDEGIEFHPLPVLPEERN
jgi:hypothetical protein